MPPHFTPKFTYLIFCLFCASPSTLSHESSDFLTSGSNKESIAPSYFYYQQGEYPRDCLEIRNQCSTNNLSGVYFIKPEGFPEPFEVYCDNEVDSGGWTVINRHQDGSVLFNRNWTEYEGGFGFLSREFWLGNDKLSFLTNQNTYELRIDVTSVENVSFHVTYNRFRISDEHNNYKLTSVGDYSAIDDSIHRFWCTANTDFGIYISDDCSRRCSCVSGTLTCDDTYRCDLNAVCETRNNGSQCYCNAGFTGDGVNCTISVPTDCKDIYDKVSTESGVYKIKPLTWEKDPFDVYCNMTDGGGWTVIQRRVDGSQDFFLYWSDYEDGFGTPDHELWLGNDKMHTLTAQRSYELRVDLVNKYGAPYYAKYSSFRISSDNDNYRLNVGGYSGNAGDYLSYFSGQAFTTRDRDNDAWSGGNCATYPPWTPSCGSTCLHNAGWWYSSCGVSINSPYGTDCLYWHYLPGSYCNVKFTEMKVRPV